MIKYRVDESQKSDVLAGALKQTRYFDRHEAAEGGISQTIRARGELTESNLSRLERLC
jgi:hypothetical protein